MGYDKYCIIEGYRTNPVEIPCDVTNQIKDGTGDACQRDVYIKAADIAREPGEYTRVLDIGCGSGFKLMKHFSHLDTLGIETEPNYSFLLKQYPDRKWVIPDYSVSVGYFDMVICADVIEHVMEPDIIMGYIKDINPKAIVLSTPARELVCNIWPEHDIGGPPLNTSHVREWTTEEFLNYVRKWFGTSGYIISNYVTDGIGNMVTLIKI